MEWIRTLDSLDSYTLWQVRMHWVKQELAEYQCWVPNDSNSCLSQVKTNLATLLTACFTYHNLTLVEGFRETSNRSAYGLSDAPPPPPCYFHSDDLHDIKHGSLLSKQWRYILNRIHTLQPIFEHIFRHRGEKGCFNQNVQLSSVCTKMITNFHFLHTFFCIVCFRIYYF